MVEEIPEPGREAVRFDCVVVRPEDRPQRRIVAKVRPYAQKGVSSDDDVGVDEDHHLGSRVSDAEVPGLRGANEPRLLDDDDLLGRLVSRSDGLDYTARAWVGRASQGRRRASRIERV